MPHMMFADVEEKKRREKSGRCLALKKMDFIFASSKLGSLHPFARRRDRLCPSSS